MFRFLRASSITPARRAFSNSAPNAAFGEIAKITLIGRLAKEPEIASLPSGKEMIKYVIGVSRGPDKPPSWYRVANFEPEGRGGKEYLATLPKGTLVFIEGDVTLEPYESEDGRKHNYLNIIQRSIACIRKPYKPPPAADTDAAAESAE